MYKILIVDDDPVILTLLSNLLRKSGYEVITAKNGDEGLKFARLKNPDLIITDYEMPGITGIELLTTIKESNPEMPVVMLTCHSDVSLTIKSIQAGAYDYIEKPLQPQKLLETIRNGILVSSQKRSIKKRTSYPLKRVIEENLLSGKTPYVREIVKNIGRISMTRMNVLITGETGSGIHEVANLIHYTGVTSDFPMISVNCDIIDSNKIEQVLFGYLSDDQVNSRQNRKGKLEEADEGTVYLNKFHRLPHNVQERLLKVLDERMIYNSNERSPLPFKARIIASSSDDLDALMNDGVLLKELYYSLRVFHLELPPLRERKDDIPELTEQILARQNRKLKRDVDKIEAGVIDLLQKYSWPGNILELENTISQALMFAKSDTLELAHIRRFINQESVSSLDMPVSLSNLESRHIRNVLNRVNWNKQEAARILEITRPTLDAKIKKYGIIKD